MSDWNWDAGLAFVAGSVATSLWLITPPSPNPWIRIPITLASGLLLMPLYAWLFRSKP